MLQPQTFYYFREKDFLINVVICDIAYTHSQTHKNEQIKCKNRLFDPLFSITKSGIATDFQTMDFYGSHCISSQLDFAIKIHLPLFILL